ncbi:hypothetical protein [Rhodococcus koreensis]|uniref:hypothetical protein n=1 Tax=Rhodococcus koreensis TaxID=99653 RepID=UPI00366C7CEB
MVVDFADAVLTAGTFVATIFSAAVFFRPVVFAEDFLAAVVFAGAFPATIFVAATFVAGAAFA